MLPLLLLACSDFTLVTGEDVEIPETPPSDVRVTPAELIFETAVVGDLDGPLLETVTVANEGEGPLEIHELELTGDAEAFTLTNVGSALVGPGEYTTFLVSFVPVRNGPAAASIRVGTNDPDQPSATVLLAGAGIAPEIALEPAELQFGYVDVGCTEVRTITATNVGGATLIIEGTQFLPDSEELDQRTASPGMGPLPWSLEPGESIEMRVSYAPFDDQPDQSYLRVRSNDPWSPDALATQAGRGRGTWQEDSFDEVIVRPVDVLFALDTSPSMTSDLGRVADNIEVFLDALDDVDSQYHVAAVVKDDGCVLGGAFIDPGMSPGDRLATFEEMLSGEASTYAEAPFELLSRGLSQAETGCNAGFLRDEATLSLVTVSDEDDQSPHDWRTYVEEFRGLKNDPDDVVVNAIAGDVPDGCLDNAPGWSHADAVDETGGVFVSICSDSYGAELSSIASASLAAPDSFPLSEQPVPESISVAVEGGEVDGWTWSEALNTVIYDGAAPGEEVTVRYIIAEDCSPE